MKIADIDVAANNATYDTTSATVNNGYNNYQYDPLGNLIKDTREKITNISWTVAGKVKSVTHVTGQNQKNLLFRYGADGQRVSKDVLTDNGTLIERTYYIRDAQGNVMTTYKYEPAGTFSVLERNLYGSDHLGVVVGGKSMYGMHDLMAKYPPATPAAGSYRYGLKDHLGNVTVVITGDRFGVDDDNNGSVDYSVPKIVEQHGYEPFGSLLPGRNVSFGANYRFGFQEQEKDDEAYGCAGTALSFEYRVHDSRIGRFLTLDPLASKYPWNSPYSFSENRVIDAIELEGLEAVVHTFFVSGRKGGGSGPPFTVIGEREVQWEVIEHQRRQQGFPPGSIEHGPAGGGVQYQVFNIGTGRFMKSAIVGDPLDASTFKVRDEYDPKLGNRLANALDRLTGGDGISLTSGDPRHLKDADGPDRKGNATSSLDVGYLVDYLSASKLGPERFSPELPEGGPETFVEGYNKLYEAAKEAREKSKRYCKDCTKTFDGNNNAIPNDSNTTDTIRASDHQR